MRDLRERTAFFKKALEPQAVQRLHLCRHLGQAFTLCPGDQRRWQVLLDGDLLALAIERQVHHAKTARSKFAHDTVSAHHGVGLERSRSDLGHNFERLGV